MLLGITSFYITPILRRRLFKLDLELRSEGDEPVPGLEDEVVGVGEVGLAGRRVDDGLKRDAEERQRQEEDEYPEDEAKHGRRIIQRPGADASISACRD